jgi:uncharacterized protein (TIGR00369 family)
MEDPNLADACNAMNAPFAKMIGIHMTLVTKARVEAELFVSPDHCTLPTGLHGGALMAFADNVAACGAVANLPGGASTTTIESKTNFLRPAPVGETVRAIATPVHIGRSLHVWKTDIIRADGKLAAVVTQTQMVIAARQT